MLRRYLKFSLNMGAFVVLCACCALPIQTRAQANDATIQIWLFNLFHSGITRAKTQDYFTELSRTTQFQYVLTVDNDIPALLERCPSGKPDIVAGSSRVAQEVASRCAYKPIAITKQEICLLSHSPETISLKQVKKIGLVRGVDATLIAEKQLSVINNNYRSVTYPTIFELLKNIKQDQIDSIPIACSMISLVPLLEKEWQLSFRFEEKGLGVFLVSPELSNEFVNTIQQELLSNSAISVDTWQRRFGLGAFEAPPADF